MGKTTLLDALQRGLPPESPTLAARVGGVEQEAFRPYYLAARIFVALLDAREDRGAAVMAALPADERGLLARVLPGLSGEAPLEPPDRDDPAERDLKLRAWLDLPRHLYVGFEDGERAYAQFDARQVGEERVSSVQYLKFRTGGRVPTVIGSDLPDLSVESWLTEDQRKALNEDLTTKI